jgi:phospholipase A1
MVHSELPTMNCRRVLSLLTVAWLLCAHTDARAHNEERDRCILGFLETGADSLTLGEMRARCAPAPGRPDAAEGESNVEFRLAAEREAAARPFSILAHRPNYVLFGAYNFEGWDPTLLRDANNDPDYRNDDIEMQFQFSFKVPLAIDLFKNRMDLFFGYTNRSFWQAYNGENSEPFRETNHEPEIWAQFRNRWRVLGFTNAVNTFGWVHQSNGRTEPLSRNWNRLYANFIFERDDLVLSFRPWVWLAKDKADTDNPDIDDFMGHGEVRGAWQRNGHVISMMLRNWLESGFDHGAAELSWSFPVFGYPFLKGYLQYFYGYGESLIDYNHKVNRIGLGISVTDWLD